MTTETITGLMRLSERATQGEWQIQNRPGDAFLTIRSEGGEAIAYLWFGACDPFLNSHAIAGTMNFIRSPAFAELRRDAERLEFLISNNYKTEASERGWRVYDTNGRSLETEGYETARAAIDAAIAREDGNG